MKRSLIIKINILIFSLFLSISAHAAYYAPMATESPVIDGMANDASWQQAQWQKMDKHILGDYPSAEDFSGRFKVVWDNKRLYLLAEIVDDVLFDQHADPLDLYWDDDSLEILIDEDHSGGIHQFDYNAFAYHVALDNQAIDIGSDSTALALNDHLTSVWKRDSNDPHKVIWEIALDVYDDSFDHNSPSTPVTLEAGKIIGFMLAYCDNDGSPEREHFIGNVEVQPVNGDKNLGYIDASVFGELVLQSNEGQ